ncbi:MAG: hypothetical protein ABSA07_08415 [Acidimicrobiales bacterium]
MTTAELSRETTASRSRARDRLGLWCGVAGIVLWIYAVHHADFARMSGYGLASILDGAYYLGLALVIIGFCSELVRPVLRPRRLIFLIVVLVVFMYGTAPAIEPLAAYPESFVHTGFIQYILVHGHPLDDYDGRFSWPGAFSMAAVLTKFVGHSSAMVFTKWFPLFIELAGLAPLIVITRSSGVERRVAWLAIAVFYSSNWIFQDYFSPQGLNYFFFLVIVAAVFACWKPLKLAISDDRRKSIRTRFRRTRMALSRDRLAGRDVTSAWGTRQMVGLLGLLGLLFVASTISHQLTPPAIVLALVAMLMTRRLGRPELVVILVVLVFGWLSLGASNYWAGHLSNIFGSFGDFASKFSSNVANRVTGLPAHRFIAKLRILITGILFLGAAIGSLRRSADSRTLEVLVAVPFLLVAAQNYGGEGLIRVVLFGLPFSSLLFASMFWPPSTGDIRSFLPQIPEGSIARLVRFALPTLIATALVVLSFATTIARGGNDSFQSMSAGDLSAVEYVYAHAPPGVDIDVGMTNAFMPLLYKDVGVIRSFADLSVLPKHLGRDTTRLLRRRPLFILLSKSEEAYGEQVLGYPAGWQAKIKKALLKNGYRVVAHYSTAVVLRETPVAHFYSPIHSAPEFFK